MRLAFLAVAIITGGCPLILPMPYQINAPAEEIVQMIKPQVTTRTDVLMTLGDPNFRLEDDRFFVYDWAETQAVVGIILGPNLGVGTELGSLRALAIEFVPDGRVARLKEFHAERQTDIAGSTEKAGRKLWGDIRVWMKVSHGTAQ